MGLPQIISRNQIQRIATTALNVRKVLSGGTDGDFYTCPAGKKAIIKGSALCTGRGAAGTVNLEANAVVLFTWDRVTAVIGSYLDKPRALSTVDSGQLALFEVQLTAGQILRYTQNTGTNAEMNIFAEILETPA